MSKILTDFFHSELGALQANVPVHTQVYVAELLARFGQAANVFGEVDGKRDLEPLALMLARAVETQDETQRLAILRKLGDTALFTTGLFSENITRRGVGLEYFMAMGGRAYSQVATMARPRSGRRFGDLYAALSAHFKSLVRMLWDLGERLKMAAPADLLTVYRRWEKTGTERDARLLVKAGMVLPAAKARRLVC